MDGYGGINKICPSIENILTKDFLRLVFMIYLTTTTWIGLVVRCLLIILFVNFFLL